MSMDQKNNYSLELSNGLTVSCDYIAFTITEELTNDEIIFMMGFHPDDFHQLPKGGFGYKKQLKSESTGISILYDGAEDMGTHVNITGKGIAPLLNFFSRTQYVTNPFDDKAVLPTSDIVLSLFFKKVLEYGHFTRVDIAIDDFGGKYFSPDNVFQYYQNNQVVSKWRTVKRNDKFSAPKTCNGYTLYFGSRESCLMLRIYDKKLEQNNKLSEDDEDYIKFNWFRWELEYKDERATEFAEQLVEGVKVADLAVGVLHHYIRIINLDDCNKSRCTNLQLWDEFINSIKSRRLHLFKKERTVIDKFNWLEKQVAPTLAVLLLLCDFDTSFLYEIASKNKFRISKSDWELIRELKPEVYEAYHEEV